MKVSNKKKKKTYIRKKKKINIIYMQIYLCEYFKYIFIFYKNLHKTIIYLITKKKNKKKK